MPDVLTSDVLDELEIVIDRLLDGERLNEHGHACLRQALATARDYARLESDNHRMSLGDMSVVDYERLVEWIKNSNRKPPSAAFTAGAARTAAMAVEDSGLLSELADCRRKLAEAEGRN